MKTGYFVHFWVSPFFSLASFASPFSLYVSLFFVSCFLFFLPCFLMFLSLFFAVLSCLVSLLLSYEYKTTSNITFERFLFINYFCFLGFPVLSCLSNPFSYFCFSFFQLCVLVNTNVFIFQRRPFLKHQVLFCASCKVNVFWRADFEGKFGWRSKNTVEIGISAHD